MKEYEIIKRSNGYWIEDSRPVHHLSGYAQGPYDTVEDAEADVPEESDLQYPLDLN